MQSIEYFKEKRLILQRVVESYGTPTFVCDKNVLHKKVKDLKSSFNKNTRFFFAIKANFNPSLVEELQNAGIDGIETISIYEILLAKKLGFSEKDIMFSANNASIEELSEAVNHKVTINIGSLSELMKFGDKHPNQEISLRLNPGFGDGEFKEIITGGEDSKFGIHHYDLQEAIQITKKYNLKIIGIHCHLGSGLYNTTQFSPMVKFMFKIGSTIDSLRFINLGGGFGIKYKTQEKAIDLNEFSDVINQELDNFPILKELNIIFEPGKYLAADSTCLLTKITNIRKNKNSTVVCVDTGMNHIIRPALYGSYHHIINLSKLDNIHHQKVRIAGNICESTDIINDSIEIADPQEGYVLAILTAGAYCSSMSSLYNLKPYAAEIMIDDQNVKLTKKRLSFEETLSSLGFVK